MGICMWNMGNMDYGQMGITEDYLMWFLFMYSLQSDYYLYLFLLLTTHTLFGLDIYLYLAFPSCSCSCATSNVVPTSFSVTLLVHTPTFIGTRHRLDMHTFTSDQALTSNSLDHQSHHKSTLIHVDTRTPCQYLSPGPCLVQHDKVCSLGLYVSPKVHITPQVNSLVPC